MSEPWPRRIKIQPRADGHATFVQSIPGDNPLEPDLEGMRLRLTWYCPCDNHENLNLLVHIGEHSVTREIVELEIRRALDRFFAEIEHHKAK